MCHVNPRVSFLGFGGTKAGSQYMIGAFPVRLKRVLLEVFLSNRQNIQFIRFILGHLPPRVHCENIALLKKLFLIAFRLLLYWSISPFTSCESKEARASCDCLQVRELMSSERGGSEIQNDQ